MPVLLFLLLALILLVVLIRRPVAAPPPHSLSLELERLESLRLRGLLSTEEFEQCKRRVLHSPTGSPPRGLK